MALAYAGEDYEDIVYNFGATEGADEEGGRGQTTHGLASPGGLREQTGGHTVPDPMRRSPRPLEGGAGQEGLDQSKPAPELFRIGLVDCPRMEP